MRAIRFITAAALVLIASTASAQGGQGMTPEQRQARQNEMLFKDITLTEVQKAKIDTIQVKAREASAALMQSGGMQDSATRATMMANRTKTMADVRAVLTAEQQVVFDKNLAAMPQGGGRRPPN
jgi:Spy/CpxP family protein refolding chaperone